MNCKAKSDYNYYYVKVIVNNKINRDPFKKIAS